MENREEGGATRTLKLEGEEFTRRYLRHVLPQGLRRIRYYGFSHPAAKKTRLNVTLLSGRPFDLGAPSATTATAKPSGYLCPCCGKPMVLVMSVTRKDAEFMMELEPLAKPPQADFRENDFTPNDFVKCRE